MEDNPLNETMQIMSLDSAIALGYRHRDEAGRGEIYFAYSLSNAFFGPDPYPYQLPREQIQVAIVEPEKAGRSLLYVARKHGGLVR